MITVRKDAFQQACAEAGIDSYAQLARTLGVSPSTVSRVMGGAQPGVLFVAGSIRLLGKLEDLFEVTA